jgi:hypothetical protein
MVLADAAIARFGRGVGVDVDQAREGQQTPAVDDLLARAGRPGPRRRDLDDLPVLQMEVELTPVNVPAG